MGGYQGLGQRQRSWPEAISRAKGGVGVGSAAVATTTRTSFAILSDVLTDRCKRERERGWAERKSGGGGKERGKAAGSAGLQVEKAVYKLSLVGDVVVLWAKSVSWGWGAKGGKKKRQASRPG